jgi:hypothetical protein
MPQSMPRPEDPATRRRAAIASGDVHQLLAAAGAWLRSADETHRAEAEEALASTTPAQVRDALAAIDPGETAEALSRAAEEAFEAAFEEDDEEREALASAAITSLSVRDDVESTLCAVDFVARHTGSSPEAASLREAASALRAGMEIVDAAARARSRALSPVNVLRRERAAELAEAHRAAAWWFTDRASAADDGLVEALAGLEVTPGERALADLSRAPIAPRKDALGAALRAAEEAREDDPSLRWARAEASRSEAAAIALSLVRELRVEAIED